jgi:hypothetical protein
MLGCPFVKFWHYFKAELIDILYVQFRFRPVLLQKISSLYEYDDSLVFLSDNISFLFKSAAVEQDFDSFLDICILLNARPDELAMDYLEDAVAAILINDSITDKIGHIQAVLEFIASLNETEILQTDEILLTCASSIGLKLIYSICESLSPLTAEAFQQAILILNAGDRQRRLKKSRPQDQMNFIQRNFLGLLNVLETKLSDALILGSISSHFIKNISQLFLLLISDYQSIQMETYLSNIWRLMHGILTADSGLMVSYCRIWEALLMYLQIDLIPFQILIESFFYFDSPALFSDSFRSNFVTRCRVLSFLIHNSSISTKEIIALLFSLESFQDREVIIKILKAITEYEKLNKLQLDSNDASRIILVLLEISRKKKCDEILQIMCVDLAASVSISVDYSHDAAIIEPKDLQLINLLIIETQDNYLSFLSTHIKQFLLPYYKLSQGQKQQDFIAFCIQEMYRLFSHIERQSPLDFQHSKENSLDSNFLTQGQNSSILDLNSQPASKPKFWRDLVAADIALLQPLKISKFRLSVEVITPAAYSSLHNAKTSVLTFRPGMSFQAWLTAFLKKIVVFIKDDLLRRLFSISFLPLLNLDVQSVCR